MPYAGGYGGGKGKGGTEKAAGARKGLKMGKPGQMSSVSPLTKSKAKARTKVSSRVFGGNKTADKGQRTKGAMGLKGLKF